MAGTAFGLEAVVDVASRLADDKRNDFRIEAAIAKLYGSELGWQAVDTMIQIRGGRGYETAESLARRGEKPVPAEQLLRDMRINRIFEGSTEIMHLIIAREAVDQHLQAAGGVLDPEVAIAQKAGDALKAAGFYAKWFPQLAVGEGQKRGAFSEFGPLAGHLRYAERSARKLARSTFYAMGRYQASLEQRGHLLGRIVDIGAELYAISCACVYASSLGRRDPGSSDEAFELADLFCKQARRRSDVLFSELWSNDDTSRYRGRPAGARGPLHLVRSRRARSRRRRAAHPGARGQRGAAVRGRPGRGDPAGRRAGRSRSVKRRRGGPRRRGSLRRKAAREHPRGDDAARRAEQVRLPRDAVLGQQSAEKGGAPGDRDRDGDRQMGELALEQSTGYQVGRVAEDHAARTQVDARAGGDEPGARSAHRRHDHRDEQHPGQAAERDQRAHREERDRVRDQVAEAHVQEGRGRDARRALVRARNDPVLVEVPAERGVEELGQPHQGHHGEHEQ
jgi:hypothetical protein